MLNSLKILLRNIIKFRLYSILNVAGLSLGLASVIFIFLWVFNELGYDKFNSNYDNVYQINFETTKGIRWANTPAPLAPAIINNVPGVKSVVRIRKCPAFAFSTVDKMFYEGNGITSDPEIFDIFSFKTLMGDPKEALNTSDNMVVTKSFARKYFGNGNPINKQLTIEGEGFLTIKAVIEDVPKQSHIQFDYILSHKFAVDYHLCGLGWGDPNFRTYILLQKNARVNNVLSSITKIAMDNKLPNIYYGENKFNLRPLKNIYLDNEIENSLGLTGDKRKVIVFGSVGILILLLACINYINLSVSLFTKRQKSSAIRKICGAFRKDIFIHQLSETLFLIFISFIIALDLVLLLKPFYNSLIGKDINLEFFKWQFITFIILVFMGTIFVCGIYPSFLLSSPKAIHLFEKPGLKYNKNRGLQMMVGLQNVISILLIICTIGIFKQMNFIRKKDLGFNSKQIVYVTIRGNISKSINVVKNKLSSYPGITQIAFKDCLPYGIRNNTRGVMWKEKGVLKNTGEDSYFGSETTRIDAEYFKMMGVKFALGRNFNDSLSSDKQDYILNEKAVRQMGLSDPIGEEFALYGRWGKIIGVIKDTYFKSLHEKIEPQVFYLFKDLEKESYFSTLLLKINGTETHTTLKYVEKIWNEYNPGIPFEYHFLDSDYETLYKSDRHTAKMINVFSLLAVFIACLGLFGQSTLAAENKIKEIGIRKVTGAKTYEVVIMLNKNFIKWIIAAFVIACPIAYFAMQKWLQNFAYRTDLSWWLFLVAGLIATCSCHFNCKLPIIQSSQ